MTIPKTLYGKKEIAEAVKRIADEILTDFGDDIEEVALVGLYKQGVPLSERIAAAIRKKSGKSPRLGKLDISMYRDDFGLRSALPIIRETLIPFDMHNARVILVDDVLSSGRTIRAALDAVTDYGRPASIYLAVLIDREATEYPIRADYIGFVHKTEANRKLLVDFGADGKNDKVEEIEWRQD